MRQAEQTPAQPQILLTVLLTEPTADPDRGCNQQKYVLVLAAAGPEQPKGNTVHQLM